VISNTTLYSKLPDRDRRWEQSAPHRLRISEALGLKWEDVDFEKGQANVLRSVVDGSVSRCKSEVSQQPG
jgi:integrase